MNAGFAVLAAVPALALVPPLHRVVAATGPSGLPPAEAATASGPGPAVASPRRPSLVVQAGVTAAAAVGVAVALRAHPGWLPAYLYLVAVGVALGITDLRVHRLPDVLTLPSYPVLAALFGVAAAIDGGSERLVRAAVAGGVVWLAFAALWTLSGDGLGLGDVKISGLIGAALGWLGWGNVVVGLGIGMITAGLVAAVLLLIGRADRRSRIAYGPYLLLGTLAAVLLAHPA